MTGTVSSITAIPGTITKSIELYDLDDDPEEISDLYPAFPALARQMQDELQQKVLEANRPFDRA